MDLIRFNHLEDFGHEFYIQVLNMGRHAPKWMRRSLLQFSVSWNDYPSWPYIQITLNGASLSMLFWVYKFGFDIDILSYTWKFDSLPGTSR